MVTVESLMGVLRKAGTNFSEDQVPRLSAALTFYLMLSLAPMLLLLAGVFDLLLTDAGVKEALLREVNRTMGQESGEFIGGIIARAGEGSSGIWATVISLLLMLFAASNLFEQLRVSVNAIWGLKAPQGGLKQIIKRKLIAILLVLIGGTIMIAWLGLDAWIAYAARHQPFGDFPLWRILSLVIGAIFWAGVFAVSFRMLPRRWIAWRDVIFAAILTSLLFSVARYLLNIYFSYSSVSVAYGSAGAFVVILLWTYYSSMIFFFGVEASCAYAHQHGSLKEVPEDEENRVLETGVAKEAE